MKSPTGYRNGYKARQLMTRVGKLELLVPQDRDGTFKTELFERYQRSEQALVLSLMEMYVEGVSTRKVREVTETWQRCHVHYADLGCQVVSGRRVGVVVGVLRSA